jgi:hypothetical protein
MGRGPRDHGAGDFGDGMHPFLETESASATVDSGPPFKRQTINVTVRAGYCCRGWRRTISVLYSFMNRNQKTKRSVCWTDSTDDHSVVDS